MSFKSLDVAGLFLLRLRFSAQASFASRISISFQSKSSKWGGRCSPPFVFSTSARNQGPKAGEERRTRGLDTVDPKELMGFRQISDPGSVSQNWNPKLA